MKGQFRGILGFLLHLFLFMLGLSVEAQTLSFLVNCGTNSSVNVDGRRWIGDTSIGNNLTLSTPARIEASTSLVSGDHLYEPLYRTARIFSGSLNYSLQVPNGNYFLRLHFYPFVFYGYNVNESYFSVEANGLKLVSEFKVPGEIADKNLLLQGSAGGANSSFSYVLKEYFFYVESNSIVVSFTPSEKSFGFVNAIEIVEEGNELFDDSVMCSVLAIQRGIVSSKVRNNVCMKTSQGWRWINKIIGPVHGSFTFEEKWGRTGIRVLV